MGQFQWMFSLIPDSFVVWLYYLFTAAGLALYIGSKLVNLIPFMGQYKLPAEIGGVVVLVVTAYFLGGFNAGVDIRERIKEMQDKVAVAEAQSKEVNTVIETKIVERVKIVEKKVEVVKTIIQRDKEAINAKCEVPEIAIIDYNKAIADPIEGKQ
jgi:hypothetical protein